MSRTIPPTTLIAGRYRIVKLLGQGGFGAVYLAEDIRLGNKRVALKEGFDRSVEAQEQFRLEGRLLAVLSHSGLPRVTDTFIEPDGRQFLVMDFVEGDDLHDRIIRTGQPLPEREAAAILLQVCEAVAFLHEQQPQPIIHRDIKPPNIKITRDGRAVLVDFGIAKIYHPTKTTVPVAKAYSPHFSPPEQHVGKTDKRSDVYALGATLYCLITATVPPDSMDRLTKGTPLAAPTRVNRQVGHALEKLVLRALELTPDRRYSGAREMAEALRAYLGAQPVAVPAGSAAVVEPRCPRCNNPNRPGARFCKQCGTRLPETAAGASTPPGLASGAPPGAPVGSYTDMPPQLRFEMANAHVRSENYEAALAEYQRCLQANYTHPAVFHNLGYCLIQLNRPAEAASVLARGVAMHPNDPELHYQTARAYQKLGQRTQALAAAERACQLSPQDAYNLRLYGMLLMDARRYGDAARQLEQAARLEPDEELNHFYLGQAMVMCGQRDQALNLMRSQMHAHPDWGLIYFVTGEILFVKAHYQDAIAAFARAAELRPRDPDPHIRLARCFSQLRRRAEAVQAAQHALAIDPQHAGARDLLAKL